MQHPTNPTTETEAMIGSETSVFAAIDVPTHQPTQAVPTIPAATAAAHVPVPAAEPTPTRWIVAAAALGVCGLLGAGLALATGGGTAPDPAVEMVEAEVVPLDGAADATTEVGTADVDSSADAGAPASTDADDPADADDQGGETPADAGEAPVDEDDGEAPGDGGEPGDDDPVDPGDGPDWELPGDLIPLPTIPPWEPPTDFLPVPTIPEPPVDGPEDIVFPTLPPGPDPVPPVIPGELRFDPGV